MEPVIDFNGMDYVDANFVVFIESCSSGMRIVILRFWFGCRVKSMSTVLNSGLRSDSCGMKYMLETTERDFNVCIEPQYPGE